MGRVLAAKHEIEAFMVAYVVSVTVALPCDVTVHAQSS